MRIILGWFRINSINTNVSVSNNLIVRTLETLRFATERCCCGDMRPKSLRLLTTRLAVQLSAGRSLVFWYGKVP